MVSHTEVVASILFAIAIIHTFSVPVFARLANKGGSHAGLWHLLSEVEAVFGVWACVLFVWMGLTLGVKGAVEYLDTRNFTEPAFVFVIMVVAASRPIIEMVRQLVDLVSRLLPVARELSRFFVIMTLVPLAGSLITEPAAMTLAALLLRQAYFGRHGQDGFKYLTVGVLFVLPIVLSMFSFAGEGWKWIVDASQYLPMSGAQSATTAGGDEVVRGLLTLAAWPAALLLGAWAALRGRDA